MWEIRWINKNWNECIKRKTLTFKVLTTDHLNEYRKQFFVGPKSNWTICGSDDLDVESPVKEYWKFVYNSWELK